MNMISTGSFLTEADISNKQETVAEKFARVWEKKNAKVARAGGVSLMALSLAACGSDESDPAPVDPTPVDPTPVDPTPPAPTVQSLTVTNGDVVAGTAANEIFEAVVNSSATLETYQASDVVIDSSSTDADVLNIAADDDVTATATVTNIETVNWTLDALVATGGVNWDIALNNISKGTAMSFDLVTAGSAVSVLNVTGDLGGARSVSSDFKTISTDSNAATTWTIDAAGTSVTPIALTGTGTGSMTVTAAGHIDVTSSSNALVKVTAEESINIDAAAALSVIANGGSDVTIEDATQAVALNVNSGGDATVTLAPAVVAPVITAAGTVDATVAAATSAVVSASESVTLASTNTLGVVNVTDTGAVDMDVDLTGAGTALTSITLSGRNDVTVELDGGDLETREAADLLAGDTFELGLDTTGLTNGATSTINVSTAFGGANASLAKVDVDVIELSATSTADNVTVKSGSTVLISADQTALTIDGADATASSNTIAVNIDDGVDSAAASAAAMTSLAFTDFGSVVINNGLDTLADGTAETVTMNTLTSADGGITLNLGANDLINDTVMGVTTAHNIVVTGSGDVDFTNSAVTAKVLDASAVTGDVTANVLKSDQVATVKTGAGDDTLTTTAAVGGEVDMSISAGAGDDEITLHTAAGTVNSLTIDGGDGDDTLNIADGGDHQATGAGEVVTITGIENIVLAGDADLSTSFMNNASFNMESAAGADAIGVIVETGDTAIDISGLTTTAANAAANAADTYTVSAALSTTVTAITGTDIALNALTAGDIVGATLTGGALADTLNGGAKADTIVGGAGVDTIDGNGGADTIDGGAGADEITGGTGADTLTGGADADDFNFVTGDTGITLATADTITDFVTASDQIDVTMTGALGAADAVVLDGSAIASFTAMVTAVDAIFAAGGGNNDDVVAYYDALGTGNAYVFVDEDNSGAFAAGDTLIVLTGINAASELAASDFIS